MFSGHRLHLQSRRREFTQDCIGLLTCISINSVLLVSYMMAFCVVSLQQHTSDNTIQVDHSPESDRLPLSMLSEREFKQQEAQKNDNNYTILAYENVPDDAPHSPVSHPYTASDLDSKVPFTINIETHPVEPITPLPSASISSILSSKHPSRIRMVALSIWGTFLVLHLILFSWLLSIHLRKDQYGQHYIHALFPMIAGFLEIGWMIITASNVVIPLSVSSSSSSNQQSAEMMSDPLLEMDDANSPEGIAARVRASHRRWARRVLLTFCILGELFLCYLLLLAYVTNGFEASADQHIPGVLMLFSIALNPLAWAISFKYS